MLFNEIAYNGFQHFAVSFWVDACNPIVDEHVLSISVTQKGYHSNGLNR